MSLMIKKSSQLLVNIFSRKTWTCQIYRGLFLYCLSSDMDFPLYKASNGFMNLSNMHLGWPINKQSGHRATLNWHVRMIDAALIIRWYIVQCIIGLTCRRRVALWLLQLRRWHCIWSIVLLSQINGQGMIINFPFRNWKVIRIVHILISNHSNLW